MKFDSGVSYIKTIKKARETIKAQLCITPFGQKTPPTWELPIEWKIYVPKYSHKIYQSIDNFMYSPKNIKTFCSKSTEKVLSGQNSPQDFIFKISPFYITFDGKFYVLSEKT